MPQGCLASGSVRRMRVAHQASASLALRRDPFRTGLGLLFFGGLASALGGCGELGGAFSGQPQLELSRDPQLFIVGADGGARRRLTRARGWHGSPSWSPDGRRLVYAAGCGLETIAHDGSRRRTLLGRDQRCPTAVSWSPQGNLIAFAAHAGDPGPSTIETIDPSGSDRR